MTWNEMQSEFPNEWLLVTDFELNEYGEIKTGIVKRHSKKKDDIYCLPRLNQSCAFEYTGESTFSGLRSHAEHNCL